MIRDAFFRRGWLLPLLLSLFVDNVRGTPVRAVALLSAFLWSAWAVRRAGRRPVFPPALVVFLLWCAAGLLFSSYRAGTLAELFLLAGAVSLWVGMSALWDVHPEEKAVFSRGILALGLFKAATIFFSPASDGRLFLDLSDDWVANTSLTAMFLCLGVVAAWPSAGSLWRGLWGGLSASALWVCFRWNAMGALLGLAAGLPLAEAFRRRSRGFFLAAAAGALATLGVLFSPAAPRWLQYNPENPGRFERLDVWRDSLAYARAHFWTGTGLGTFEQHYPQFKTLTDVKTANHAHNEWLQLLCETGLPGLILALGLLFVGLFRGLLDKARKFPGAAAGLAALGIWTLVYYPFRSDPLLFSGAMLIALLSPSAVVPVTRRGGLVLGGAALLVGLAVFSQGTAQWTEWRGGAAWDAGATEKALSRFQRASRMDPWEPRFLSHQVECLRRLGRKEEALPLLEKAVRLKPRDVWMRRRLAVARLALVGPEAAREAYAPILDLAPGVEQFRREYEDLSPQSGKMGS